MARLTAFAFIAWLLTGVSCLQEFINPPAFGKTGDFSRNPTYTEDSTVNVVWTASEVGKKCSLVLYQLNMTNGQWFGDWEFLTRDAVDVTSYSWLVNTGKNLSESNLFYFSYFQEGKSISNMNSHYFNIVAKASPSPISSSSTSSVTPNASSTASLSISTSTSNPPSSSPTSSTSTPNSAPQSSNRLTTGAMVGIGVGILAALLTGIGAGFLWFRRRKTRRNMAAMTLPSPSSSHSPPYQHNDYRQPNGSYYGSNMNEAPPKSPVEMSHHGGPFNTHHNHQVRPAEEMRTEPVRYEMRAEPIRYEM